MTAAQVQLTSEVFWTCHLHALSTEVEEVMGLLLGDVLHQDDGSTTVRIWAAVPQIRTDRRKDRVEASPEQMARCSAKAERFSAETGTLTRVVGWYHSHPHITVLPSHIDVRTQAMYQMLDPGFIGLIISTFNEDPTMHIQTVQITAFQSVSTAAQPPQLPALDATDIEQAMAASTAAASSSGDWARREVQLDMIPSHGLAEQSLSDISKALLVTLFQEERAAYEAALEDARDANGHVDPLAALQHAATYQHHLASLIEIILGAFKLLSPCACILHCSSCKPCSTPRKPGRQSETGARNLFHCHGRSDAAQPTHAPHADCVAAAAAGCTRASLAGGGASAVRAAAAVEGSTAAAAAASRGTAFGGAAAGTACSHGACRRSSACNPAARHPCARAGIAADGCAVLWRAVQRRRRSTASRQQLPAGHQRWSDGRHLGLLGQHC